MSDSTFDERKIFLNQFLNKEKCKVILENSATHIGADSMALLNIGWLVSNAIITAGEMISEAIKLKNNE